MESNSNIDALSDFDVFFYYGQNDLEVETKSDLFQNIFQTKRTLFYDRSQDSAGIDSFENQPNTIHLYTSLPYDLVNSISKRNQNVSDGTGDYPDRRVATSQAIIYLKFDKDRLQINFEYIPLASFRQTDKVRNTINISL